MNSILTSISGQFGQSFLLGTFVPVVVFIISFQIFVTPLLPTQIRLLMPLETITTPWQLVDISFLALVLSGLLYNLNIPIICFYEGYPWQESWIGKKKKRRYQAQFDNSIARFTKITKLLSELHNTDYFLEQDKKEKTKIEEIEEEWNKIARKISSEFPGSRNLVLPTRLGNTIRSFESYPSYQYGIDSVTLWTRLIAKIDKDYAESIDTAKTSFDSMINSSVLSACNTLALLSIALVYPTQISPPYFWLWLSGIIIFAALTYLFYVGSIGQASNWGNMVKGAFDLYRGDLLKQLGYQRILTLPGEEKYLWYQISLQMIYGQFNLEHPAEYAIKSCVVRGNPPDTELVITRGVSPTSADTIFTISILVKNIDPYQRPSENIIVTDRLSDNLKYLWDSAQIQTGSVSVTGINPYHFFIGNLNFNEELILTYQAVVC